MLRMVLGRGRETTSACCPLTRSLPRAEAARSNARTARRTSSTKDARSGCAEFGSAYEEVKHRFSEGIREFCFYEDNLLLGKANFIDLIQKIADDPELKGIELHAPEGIEVRLLHLDVVRLMRRAGFKKLYLPLESVNVNMQQQVGSYPHEYGQVLLCPQ